MVASVVHLVDLCSEVLCSYISFQLEARGDHVRVFFHKLLRAQVNFLRAFKTIKLILGGELVDRFQDQRFNFFRYTNLMGLVLSESILA